MIPGGRCRQRDFGKTKDRRCFLSFEGAAWFICTFGGLNTTPSAMDLPVPAIENQLRRANIIPQQRSVSILPVNLK
jgi:hypothetical protein